MKPCTQGQLFLFLVSLLYPGHHCLCTAATAIDMSMAPLKARSN